MYINQPVKISADIKLCRQREQSEKNSIQILLYSNVDVLTLEKEITNEV